jgi:hypothetical protein
MPMPSTTTKRKRTTPTKRAAPKPRSFADVSKDVRRRHDEALRRLSKL